MDKVGKQLIGTLVTFLLSLFVLIGILDGFSKALVAFISLVIMFGIIFSAFKFFGWIFKVKK